MNYEPGFLSNIMKTPEQPQPAIKLKRVWTMRHYRVPLVAMASATLYAVIVRAGFSQLEIQPQGWEVPAVANGAGLLTAFCARMAWFDSVPRRKKWENDAGK